MDDGTAGGHDADLGADVHIGADAGVGADVDIDAVAEVEAVADEWAAAIVANDVARMGRCMAPEWVMVSEYGISAREAFLAVVASGELSHSAMAVVGRPRIRVHGDVALYTARMTNTAHYRGGRVEADEWTTDVYRRGDDGAWVCALTQVTAVAPADPADPTDPTGA